MTLGFSKSFIHPLNTIMGKIKVMGKSYPLKSHPAWNKGLSREFQPRYQKKHSKETIEKMRIKALNRKHTEATRLKISQIQVGKRRKPLSVETKQKIRLKHIGKKLSEEHKQKLSKSHIGVNVGSKNNNWAGGIMFEPYDSNFNINFKNGIRQRENQCCLLCGIHREKIKNSFHIHHVNYDKKLSIKENCVALCNNCHGKTNQNREEWKILFQSILSKKYNYKYENQKIILEVTNERRTNSCEDKERDKQVTFRSQTITENKESN